MEIKIKIPNISSLKLIKAYQPREIIGKGKVTYTKKYVNDLIPKKPGIYLLYNDKKKLLYVGQSINLFQRLSSYHSTIKPKYVKFFVYNKSQRERMIIEQILKVKLEPSLNKISPYK